MSYYDQERSSATGSGWKKIICSIFGILRKKCIDSDTVMYTFESSPTLNTRNKRVLNIAFVLTDYRFGMIYWFNMSIRAILHESVERKASLMVFFRVQHFVSFLGVTKSDRNEIKKKSIVKNR